MEKEQEQEKPKPYITIPRFIASDYKEGKILRNEMILLLWLRLNTNPFGIASVNLSAIREDIFSWTKSDNNYVNKLLLSLRSKRYLYYENRQGLRGSFEVHFGDWLLPDRKIRHIDHHFNQGEVRSEITEEVKDNTEVSHKSVVQSQKLKSNNSPFNDMFSDLSSLEEVLSNYNDKDKDKEKDNDNIVWASAFKKKKTKVKDFYPTTYEEQRCKEIAEELGEEHINYLLSVKHKHGFNVIERAWGIYREDMASFKDISNPPAYFQGIIKKTLLDDSGK